MTGRTSRLRLEALVASSGHNCRLGQRGQLMRLASSGPSLSSATRNGPVTWMPRSGQKYRRVSLACAKAARMVDWIVGSPSPAYVPTALVGARLIWSSFLVLSSIVRTCHCTALRTAAKDGRRMPSSNNWTRSGVIVGRDAAQLRHALVAYVWILFSWCALFLASRVGTRSPKCAIFGTRYR